MTGIQDAIVKAMSMRHMNQAELSRLSGVSKSSLSRYIGGDDIPASKLKAIADAVGMSVDELLGIDHSTSLSDDERELLDVYRQVEPWERELILNHAKMVLLHAKHE